MRRALLAGIVVLAAVAAAMAAQSLPWAGTAGGAAESSAAGQAVELTPEEVQGLLFMREEEKLARDVYLTLYEEWGLQVFRNIAESEQRHTDAVLQLLEEYGLEDPASSEVGVFKNETLQELYNKLVEMGSRSLVDAVLVGALIEEKDIIDINNYINQTSNPEIVRVYSNLVSGSASHLRAFASQYERLTGEEYKPQLLSPEALQSIIQG